MLPANPPIKLVYQDGSSIPEILPLAKSSAVNSNQLPHQPLKGARIPITIIGRQASPLCCRTAFRIFLSTFLLLTVACAVFWLGTDEVILNRYSPARHQPRPDRMRRRDPRVVLDEMDNFNNVYEASGVEVVGGQPFVFQSDPFRVRAFDGPNESYLVYKTACPHKKQFQITTHLWEPTAEDVINNIFDPFKFFTKNQQDMWEQLDHMFELLNSTVTQPTTQWKVGVYTVNLENSSDFFKIQMNALPTMRAASQLRPQVGQVEVRGHHDHDADTLPSVKFGSMFEPVLVLDPVMVGSVIHLDGGEIVGINEQPLNTHRRNYAVFGTPNE